MDFSHQEIFTTIPLHLRQFVWEQNYDNYTPQQHAIWRFIMHQQVKHLGKTAHAVYLEGLRKTGISTEHIPSIEEMNRCLSQLGWRAVVVNGFIPPAAFMEFHSLFILPIALDMRTFEHVLYTPAPDIVHEAAGHAPFLADIDYSEYLQRFGDYGLKAMHTSQDEEIYQAIRHLSIIKETPGVSSKEIEKAEKDLKQKMASNTKPSEAALLARLFWWTVEYGLVGPSVTDYKIFGAGLLSSLGESRSCLDDKKVKKIPLTVDCTKVSYDITEPQPQLFVTKSCKHMMQVLEEFAQSMCFKKGGAESVAVAIESKTVATCEYSSGLQISGVFFKLMTNSVGREIYVNTNGPTQLCFESKELSGHDKTYHAHGFGSPVGDLKNIVRKLEDLSVDELADQGIKLGQNVVLEFLSGVTVKGKLTHVLRKNQKNILMTFENCVVTDALGTVLFDPSWGTYDMAVGHRVVSVYSGCADLEAFEGVSVITNHPVAEIKFSDEEKKLFDAYSALRVLRESKKMDGDKLNSIYEYVAKMHVNDWLIRLEILELIHAEKKYQELSQKIRQDLETLKKTSENLNLLITMGVAHV